VPDKKRYKSNENAYQKHSEAAFFPSSHPASTALSRGRLAEMGKKEELRYSFLGQKQVPEKENFTVGFIR
jgi:hypothetical protein